MPSPSIHTITLFPRIQADTAVAAYLLKTFGDRLFPGIKDAPFAFTSKPPADPAAEEQAGNLLVDLGGRFDHHRTNQQSGKRQECVSTLIARDLGLADHPAFKKLLAWALRDDLEGKGTISADPLDRAFGLSAAIMSLNRYYDGHPEKVLAVVLPILRAHVQQEYERTVELPAEWERLQAEGKAQALTVSQGAAELRLAVVESDNTALPGYLRAAQKFDVVLIRRSTGHTNILTNQIRSIDLRVVVRLVRAAEAAARGITGYTATGAVGREDQVPMWYSDDAANTFQNGGASPGDVEPTRLSLAELTALVKDGLSQGRIGSLKRQKEQGK